MATKPERVDDSPKALLLEDYKYLSDSFWKSEQSGETRFNIFIGLVTLISGALVTLATAKDLPGDFPLGYVSAIALAALAVLGIVVFLRMLSRNEHSDRCKRGMDLIRQTWKDRFDGDFSLQGYYPLMVLELSSPQGKKRGKGAWALGRIGSELRLRKFGGLAHSMAIINALLCGAAAWIYFSGENQLLAALISAGSLLVAQLVYSIHRELRFHEVMRVHDPSHACAVMRRKGFEYLFVREAGGQGWIFPCGHIEKNEGHAEAAAREAREESGWIGRPLAYLGEASFMHAGESSRIKYYLMEPLYKVEPEEEREPRWFGYKEALEAQPFEEAKQALRWAINLGGKPN